MILRNVFSRRSVVDKGLGVGYVFIVNIKLRNVWYFGDFDVLV